MLKPMVLATAALLLSGCLFNNAPVSDDQSAGVGVGNASFEPRHFVVVISQDENEVISWEGHLDVSEQEPLGRLPHGVYQVDVTVNNATDSVSDMATVTLTEQTWLSIAYGEYDGIVIEVKEVENL